MTYQVVINLDEESHQQLIELSEILKLEPEDAAQTVLATGLAYAAQRIDGDTQNPVVSIMLHSLLGVHKHPDFIQVN